MKDDAPVTNEDKVVKRVEEAVNPTQQHSMKCPKLYGQDCKCDGYHTFDELYEHRIRLFIALCKLYRAEGVTGDIWASVQHADGSTFGDWFVMGMRKEKGKQITYHLPARFWHEVCDIQGIEILEKAPEWDEHTSDDVLHRLKDL